MIYLLPLLFVINCLSREITEQEVALSILRNFPLIEEANMKREAASGEVTAARGEFDTKIKVKHRNQIEEKYDNEYTEAYIQKMIPVGGITLSGGHRQGTGFFAPYDGKYDTSPAGEIFANLSFPLLRNRSSDLPRLELQLSQLNKKIAESEVVLKKNLYLHKGLSLFRKWSLTHQKQLVIKSLLELAKTRQQMLEKRFKAGDIERLKLVDNERSILKRNEEMIKVQIELTQLSQELSLYYRDETGAVQNLASHTPKLKVDPTYIDPGDLTPQQLPQLNILEAELERNKRTEKFYEGQRLPVLNADATVFKDLSPRYSPRYPYDPERLQIGVSFEFPLENRKAEGKSVATVYKRMALQKRKQWIENELTVLFSQSKGVAKLNRERASVISKEATNAKKVADAERKRWTRGDSDLYVVALREQDVADVELKLLETNYQMEQAILDARLYSSSLHSLYGSH